MSLHPSKGFVIEAVNVWPSHLLMDEIEHELWKLGWKGLFDYLWWVPEDSPPKGENPSSVAFIRFKNKADTKVFKDNYRSKKTATTTDIRPSKEQNLSKVLTLLRQTSSVYKEIIPFLPRVYNQWGEQVPFQSNRFFTPKFSIV